MSQRITRRGFLGAGLLGGAGAILVFPHAGIAEQATESGKGVCVTLCNHWSYIGIGWQLGIESNVLSVTDAMEMADRPPHVKTCINLDARAYEFMAEKFPEVAKRLAKYLGEGKVELIGGTYGQPLGTMFSGESNVRQIVYGRETIRKALGYEMVTFLEEEEFTHPQIPQIVTGAGFRYASLAQVDTWGNAGIPRRELNALNWKGLDGTAVPCVPKNSLFGYSPDLKQLVSSAAFRKLEALGRPLLFTWEEFGWESPDEPAYLTTPEKYKKFADASPLPVEFVTLKDYLDKYGSHPQETIFFNMDSWTKLLTWGLGGDQLRIMDRKVEGLLLAAERFDAIASTMGARSKAHRMDNAWKDLLASQSHDVSLCEYSRWQGDRMAPLDRVEDYHNFTWGAIGYNHLNAAQKEGQDVLDSSVDHIIGQIDSKTGQQGQLAVTVLNPNAWERTDLVTTGRTYPLPGKARDLVVKDSSGRVVPSQIIKAEKDNQGNLIVANLAFRAEKVPSVGYDTYYVESALAAVQAANTDLQINEPQLELENQFVKVRLSPAHGAVTSLINKLTGREMLDAQKSPFPIFKGTPNQAYPFYGAKGLKIPPLFDSSKSVAQFAQQEQDPASAGQGDRGGVSKSVIRWVEKGPLRATVKTSHHWPLLRFETYVTLCAGVPWVEVTSRVLAAVPPAPDALDADHRFPIEIKNGYWLTFAPSFQPSSIIRDFPFGIEPTEHQAFQALTFVDWVGKDDGLLVLHPGTQYFRRERDGSLSNLVMREWESYFSNEYGWPRYSEYRHALMPHRPGLTHAERLRAASEFGQNLLTVVGPPRPGSLPKRKGFLAVRPEGVQLCAFRKKNRQAFELRVVEMGGHEEPATVQVDLPVTTAVETDLLGRKVAETLPNGNQFSFAIQPWKIRTFELT
jgi:hypothetical protein